MSYTNRKLKGTKPRKKSSRPASMPPLEMELFDQSVWLNSSRKLGSLEVLTQDQAVEAQRILNSMGVSTEVMKTPEQEEYTVAYWRGPRPTELDLYWQYEKTWGSPTSVTLEEHEQLGKAFGFEKEDIEWFLEEMKPEYR